MSSPLLQAKLYAPPLPPQSVPRSRLIEQLNQGLQWGSKLSLISAPAGFGKTTLAVAWLNGLKRPFAWLSLDKNDNNLPRFLEYLVGALRTVLPDVGEGLLDAYQASPDPTTLDATITSLLNELSAQSERAFALVLDDYHLIENPAVDGLVSFWLTHQPRHVHLVITSRADPSLPLARLRGRRQMNELRSDILRFNVAETAVFLQQTFGLHLSTDDIETLEKRTEGWIAGLQMAAISMQGNNDVSGFVAAFSGSHRYVLDYLADEVLAQRPSGTQQFLLKTSILDRFCAPLCDALLQSGDSPVTHFQSQKVIEQLDAANLFLIPLDNDRRWYRYHHLFDSLLQQRCQQQFSNELSDLHRRAASWFKENGYLDEAFDHMLAANDTANAAELVKAHFFELFFRGEINLVARWIAALPEALVISDVKLCVVQVWLCYFGQKPQAAVPYIDHAFNHQEVVAQHVDPALLGSLYMLRGWVARSHGKIQEAATSHEKAFTYLPKNDPGRGLNALFLGTLWRDEGDYAASIRYCLEGIQLCLEAGNFTAAMSSSYYLARIYLVQGKLQQATHYLEDKLALAKSRGVSRLPSLALIYVGLGRIYYEINDLQTAESHLQTALEMVVVFSKLTVSAQITLAWIHYWRGESEAAAKAIDEAGPVIRTWDGGLDKAEVEADLVRLWLALGNETAVSQWSAQQQTDEATDYPITQIAQARILLARGQLDQVKDLLEPLLETAVSATHSGELIGLYILQALMFAANNQSDEALIPLKEALRLAEPEGYRRIFLDEGQPMARLLYALVQQDANARYAAQLLADFPDTAPAKLAAPDPQAALVEPLSERELEVLQLVSEGLSNKEIAQKLYLSVGTVKVHTRNIYGKLGVSSRTQAVAKAQSFGII